MSSPQLVNGGRPGLRRLPGDPAQPAERVGRHGDPARQAKYERLSETLTGDRTGGKPVHATLAIHWARVVELVFAGEAVAAQARDDEITSDEIHTPPTSVVGEGVGIVEAPRGLLTHHYKTDEKGYVKEANLIVGKTNNNAAISMSIKKVAEGLIRKGAEERRARACRLEAPSEYLRSRAGPLPVVERVLREFLHGGLPEHGFAASELVIDLTI